MELIVASCVYVATSVWQKLDSSLGEELYCEWVIGNVIDWYSVAVKLTMQFSAAIAHDGVELKNVPLGFGKVLLCGLKYEEN